MRRIAGILLAAGEGRRFGGHKLLAPLADGTPLVIAAGRQLFSALPESVVVLRADDLALVAACATEGWPTVLCAEARNGMGHSLACGVAATVVADAWLVALGDMPYIKEPAIRTVVQALQAGAECVAPFHDGRRGHPVGIGARYREELLALHGDVGARAILESAGLALTRVDVNDPGVLFDIDTPAQLAAGRIVSQP